MNMNYYWFVKRATETAGEKERERAIPKKQAKKTEAKKWRGRQIVRKGVNNYAKYGFPCMSTNHGQAK